MGVNPVLISFLQDESLKRWNVMVPPAARVEPVRCAVSEIGWPRVTGVSAVVVSAVQLVRLIFVGAMKSLISELNDVEERLFRYAAPRAPHVPGFGKIASKEMTASPKVNASSAPMPSPSAGRIALVLTEARASPDAVMSIAAPQAEPVHVRIEIVGTVPPFARSYVISLSPAVRAGVMPLVEQFVGVADGSQFFWLSSKSMFVVPDGFWTRDQKSSRYLPVAVTSA